MVSVTIFVLITVNRICNYDDPSVRFAIKVCTNFMVPIWCVVAGSSIFRIDRVKYICINQLSCSTSALNAVSILATYRVDCVIRF